MKMAQRLRDVGIALMICLLSTPIAVFMTFLLLPVWSWLETTFAFESIGHSGPAEWCYLLSYCLILIGSSFIWSKLRCKSGKKH